MLKDKQMKTLPKLSEYVENRVVPINRSISCSQEVYDYTNFIAQPLNLSHFVPAIEKDGKWIVLEEPYGNGMIDKYDKKRQEYQTALDNVVFKGCSVVKFPEYFLVKDYEGNNLHVSWNNSRTIEDLIPYNLEVNETIIKKFNL